MNVNSFTSDSKHPNKHLHLKITHYIFYSMAAIIVLSMGFYETILITGYRRV